MRRIPLKTEKIRLFGQPEDTPDVTFSYAANLVGIMNASAAERGLPLSELNKTLRVMTLVDQASRAGAANVVLENADWDHLKKLIEGFRAWRIIHAIVAVFVADISEAENFEYPTEQPGA